MTIAVWVHFWVFNFIPLIYMPVSAPISCSFYHYCSIIHLEVRDWFLLWSFIAENSFALLGFLLFQSDLQIALSNSMKNWVGILIGIVSVDCFHQDLVFTILILPIQEYGRSFHLLRSSLVSFSLQRLEVLVIQIFHLLG